MKSALKKTGIFHPVCQCIGNIWLKLGVILPVWGGTRRQEERMSAL